jgi:predicted metal-dependent hydrolase
VFRSLGIAVVALVGVPQDTDLLSEPISFRTEVIVHELLHLKIPNHGRVFKALLKAYPANP